MSQRIVIRADASVAIGSGHIMRCLALAKALQDLGASVEFICQLLDGNLCDLIESRGFLVHPIEFFPKGDKRSNSTVKSVSFCQKQDAEETGRIISDRLDWLVVDHYGIGAAWESKMRAHTRRLLVVDDLANRSHDCDLLLDQNYYNNPDDRYKGLVPDYCRLLLGPGYALLSPEFEHSASKMKSRAGRIKRVLVFFGGSDPTGETEKALDAIESLEATGVSFDVVVGINNPNREALRMRSAGRENVRFYCQTPEMASLCVNADIALGAGGSANWERFCVGLPCFVVTTADNQRETVSALSDGGYIRSLGWRTEVDSLCIANALRAAISAPDEMYAMGKHACLLMKNGERQGAGSVADMMLFGARR